jgi:Carboxypeptidase regulatory-like domain/TonB dependent receptor-like, beta-barrel
MKALKIFALTALCTVLATAAFAQSARGTITGTVTDENGGVIPGAAVVAVNADNGSKYETVTTNTGNYSIAEVPIGIYNVSVELQGFGRFRQEGVRIFVAQTARVDAKLKVGALAEEVTVVADASMLKTETAEISSSITAENLSELPLNFGARGNQAAAAIRNPYTFVNLVPSGSISSYSSIKLNGAPLNTYQIRVEGMEANNNRLVIRVDQVQPSVEALEEMTVHTSNFAAEYGSVAGGVFNLVAKSGTNKYRGSAFDYYSTEKLGAGIPYTNDGSGNLVKPTNRRSNFGATVGGPIQHDKTFFFFSFEEFRQIETKSGLLATMPSDAMRRGDFSEALTGRVLATDPLGRPIMENAIYDPRTTRTAPNGQIVRDPFPGNIIPAELFDSVALKIQNYIPRATRPGIINNWDQSFPADSKTLIPSIKVDHNFNKLGGKLSFYLSRYYGPHFNGSDGLPTPITATRDIPTSTYTTRVSYDWTMSPTTLLDVRFGYLRHYNPDGPLPEVANFNPVAELGLVGAINGNGFPITAAMSTATGGGMGQQMAVGGSIPATKKPGVQASLTHARNSHTYKFGFEWRNDQLTGSPIVVGQNYNFAATQSGLPSTNGQNLSGGSVGLPYASFLMGLVNTASVANLPDPQWRKPTAGVYAQDTWKIRNNLSLDYGLRWDYQGFPYELNDSRSAFSQSIANPSAGGLLGATAYESSCNCRFVQTDKKAIGPRLGASYQISPKMVLRGGWGITYAQTNQGQSDGGGTLGAGGWSTTNYSAAAFGDPANILRQGLIYDRDAMFVVKSDPGIRPSTGQIDTPSAWISPDAGVMPKMTQWSIGLQREVVKDVVIDAAYVGNRGSGFLANNLVVLNQLSEDRIKSFGLDVHNTADQALLRARLDSAAAIARGFNKLPYASYSPANTVAQSLRPYPQFGNLTGAGVPLGLSWYDALQVKATKRYSKGLNLTYTFTWQKEYNNYSGANYNVLMSPESQKAIASNSEPLVSVLAFNYIVPGAGDGGWVKALTSDWTVGGIMRYASGAPIPVPQSTLAMNTLTFQSTRFNRVPGVDLYTKDLNGSIDPNKDFVLNPAAWVNPVEGDYSTSPAFYDDFRYQRRPDEQFSFGREFKLKRSQTFAVRLEFFNALNRTQMNNPSATNPLQTQTRNAAGQPTAGYGRIDTGSTFGPPRAGQIVARYGW